MFRDFFKSGREWIGVVLGDGPSPETGSFRAMRADGAELSAENRAALAGNCRAALPSRLCIVRELRPPALRRSRLERVIDGMLDTELPFPVEDCVTRHTGPEDIDDANPAVLAVAARKIDIRAELEKLSVRGIDPIALLPEPLVYWNDTLCIRPPASRDEPRLVVVQRKNYQTVLRGLGRRLMQCVVGRPDDGSLAERTRAAVPPPAKTPRVVFVGGLDREHAGLIARQGGAENVPDTPPHCFPDSEKWLATALARTGNDRFERRWDLRGTEFIRSSDRETLEKSPVRAAAAIALAALLLGGSAWFTQNRARERASAAWKTFGDRASALAGYRVVRRDAQSLETVRSALDERISPELSRFIAPSPLTTLRHLLEEADTEAVKLHRIDFSNGEWSIRGSAPGPGQGAALAGRLETHGLHVDRRKADPSLAANHFTLAITP